MSSEPYDPYNAPGKGSVSQDSSDGQANRDPRIAAIQDQIQDTTTVMRSNLESLAERGENIDSLEGKTNNLSQSAQGFRRGANKVRKRMWWKDMKWRIVIGVGIALLVVVIVVPIVTQT